MQEPQPFALSDQTIQALNKKAVRLFRSVRRRLSIMDFDELNVMTEVDNLFAKLDKSTRKAYKKLFIERFLESLAYALFVLPKHNDAADKVTEDTVEELSELYLFGTKVKTKKTEESDNVGVLVVPDELTHYAYDTEILRKRDRAKEAIIAANGMASKQAELDNALRYWSKQMQQYADIVSDSAQLAAYKLAGVKRVQWVSQKDEKVCTVCHKLDGKVFRIDKAPGPQHWNCRCYLVIVV